MEDSIHTTTNNKNLIVTRDFNAHARVWVSRSTCHRGNLVLEFMEALNLITKNDGVSPTWTRGQSQSFLDLTMVSTHMIGRMTHWEVMETETLSDHFYVHFTINQSPKDTYSTVNSSKWLSWRKLDSDKLQKFLEQAPFPTGNNPGALVSLLEKACDECMPRGIYKGNKKPSYW